MPRTQNRRPRASTGSVHEAGTNTRLGDRPHDSLPDNARRERSRCRVRRDHSAGADRCQATFEVTTALGVRGNVGAATLFSRPSLGWHESDAFLDRDQLIGLEPLNVSWRPLGQ